MKAPINLFDYSSYRAYLTDLYQALRKGRPKFTFRAFSEKAGFASPNFYKLVMEGKRNLSPESIEKFVLALELNQDEAAFFRNLVMLNQARSADERSHYARELLRSRSFKKLHPLKKAQFSYYSNWYNIPIRELVATRDFQESPEWIAHQLTPPISVAEARSALEQLLKLKLIERGEDGKLRQTQATVSTGDEIASASVARFHREMIQKGSEAIERFSPDERDISALTLGLSPKTAKRMKELIRKFRKDLLALAQEDSAEADGVYQVGFQFFPLSRSEKKEPTP